eukprot:359447-Chlamydomonas_euryale.AAC.4
MNAAGGQHAPTRLEHAAGGQHAPTPLERAQHAVAAMFLVQGSRQPRIPISSHSIPELLQASGQSSVSAHAFQTMQCAASSLLTRT